ncbi:MAG: chromosomal replication initiator protein DnaA [Bacteroidales bacterium]|nr:chromosomal replication initiator protein DnaA [Candidatus Physcousia equi]
MKQKEYKELWERCRAIIRNNVSAEHYDKWFAPLSFHSFNAEVHELKINTPSSFVSDFIVQNFANLTYRVLQANFGNDVRLYFRQLTDSENKISQEVEGITSTIATQSVANRAPLSQKANQAPGMIKAQSPSPELESHLLPNYSFENFIEGTSNLLLRSVGMSIAENPKNMTFNPLFVFGHSGVGKTHLVNAIGHEIKHLHPEKRVLYLSAHLFHVQYVDAVRKNTTNDFIHFYQQIDVLILDDIQEFVALPRTQSTFFHIFNHLKQNGKQLILTCDRPPTELQGMEDRLITRFKWGLLAELEQPDVKLRHNILVNKIHRNGLDIPVDVIDYISEHVTESVRDLEGIINSLMAHSVVYNCDVNLDMARRVIGHATRVENKPITIDEIIDHSCAVCQVDKQDVFSSSRKAVVSQARQIAMYLAQKHTDMSTSRIGAYIGRRNHTTVIHAVKTVTDRISLDKKFAHIVEQIENNVLQHKSL